MAELCGSSALSLLTYSLLLPHVKDNSGAALESPDALHNVAGRLYFTTTEAQGVLSQQNPLLVVSCLRDAIAQAEGRLCALHRVELAPEAEATLGVAEAHTIIYAERTDTAPAAHEAAESAQVCEAILSSCPQIFERDLDPQQSHESAATAPLCVFQDMSNTDAQHSAFWGFLAGVLQSGIRENTSAAAVAGVRGTVLPALELPNCPLRRRDVFDDNHSADTREPGGTGGKYMLVDGAESVQAAIQRFQHAVAAVEEKAGVSNLVIDVTMRRLKQIRVMSGGAAPQSQQQPHSDKKLCVVWLRSPANAEAGEDGVYADAALEMLLDELTLAAAAAPSAEEAAAVLHEEGLQSFFQACQLTRHIQGTVTACFPEVCRGERPLFHWIVCAPESFTSRLDSRVTRRTFPAATCALDDFWCAVEAIEHWKDVAMVAASMPRKTRTGPRKSSVLEGSTAVLEGQLSFGEDTAAELEGSVTTLSASLRDRARGSRGRRAARQSVSQARADAYSGSVLSRQRRKVSVPLLYGGDDNPALSDTHGEASLESSLAGSGVFHHKRGSLSGSVSGTSLLDSDEMVGNNTRRTARLIKRLPKSNTSTAGAGDA